MKRFKIKFITCLTTVALISSFLMSGYTLPGLGTILYDESTYIAPNTIYKKYIASASNGRQTAFTVELNTTEGYLTPYVYAGKATSRYTLTNIITTVENQGSKVVAGVNGDYYTLATGVPLGLTIHNGKILNSGVNHSAVLAFRDDGKAFIDSSVIEYQLMRGEESKGVVGLVNKVQGTSNSINFYNDDFGGTTGTSKDSVEVIVSSGETGAQLFVGGTVSGTVKSVNHKTTSTPLYSGEFVLSVNASSANAAILKTFAVGDTVSISTVDKSGNYWSNVVESVGAYQQIAKGGIVTTSDKTVHPRTVIGVKEDGSVVLYIVDGRQSGYSAGMNLTDVAMYMTSLGCKEVVNMDGGGSTNMGIKFPWTNTAAIVNKPSEGSQRQNANSLLFIAAKVGTGKAENLHLTPLKTHILAGASTSFTAYTSDDMFNKTNTSLTGLKYTADKDVGTVDAKGVLTTGFVSGEYTISATFEKLQAEAPIKVLGPNDLSIKINSTSEPVAVKGGSSFDFNITVTDKSSLPVVFQDKQFYWTCDTNIGTINQTGFFNATTTSGISGTIYVSYITDSAINIPVKTSVSTSKVANSNSKAEVADSDLDQTDGAEGETITVPLDYTPYIPGTLVKEIKVQIGENKVILENFESPLLDWSTGGLRMGLKSVFIRQFPSSENPEFVKEGNGSLKIWYNMKTSGYQKGAAGGYAIKNFPLTAGIPQKIGMWVYGDGKGHWLKAQLKDVDGNVHLIDFTAEDPGVNWVGYQYVEAVVPADLVGPLTLDIPVRYMQRDETKKSKGEIYIDNITAVY